jgi:hypothetical protein
MRYLIYCPLIVVEHSGDRFTMKLIMAVSSSGDIRFQCFEGCMNRPRFVEFLKKSRSVSGCPTVFWPSRTGAADSGLLTCAVTRLVFAHINS